MREGVEGEMEEGRGKGGSEESRWRKEEGMKLRK